MQSNPICESLGLSHLIIASTSTAAYSPKIKVDVIGSKPSASPKGFGRLLCRRVLLEPRHGWRLIFW